VRAAAAALCGLLLATPVTAGTDIHNLTPAERAAFGSEIRALLLDEPGIVGRAMRPPNYGALAAQDAVAQDLTLLDRLAPEILGGADIAIFVAEDCPECDAAISELIDITEASAATFKLHDMADPGSRALGAQLDLTEAPFYVMADRILRGHIPPIVLEKYLKR
jgi:hypothetical protein